MCATVCPSGALFFGTPEELAEQRSGTPINEFIFGNRTIRTKVKLMMPSGSVSMRVEPTVMVRKADLLNTIREVRRPD